MCRCSLLLLILACCFQDHLAPDPAKNPHSCWLRPYFVPLNPTCITAALRHLEHPADKSGIPHACKIPQSHVCHAPVLFHLTCLLHSLVDDFISLFSFCPLHLFLPRADRCNSVASFQALAVFISSTIILPFRYTTSHLFLTQTESASRTSRGAS